MSLRPFEISAPPPAPPSADKLAADLGLSSEERRAIKKFVFNAAKVQQAAKSKTAKSERSAPGKTKAAKSSRKGKTTIHLRAAARKK